MIVANKKFVVKLSSEERKRLSELISKGKSAAKIVLKARILLKADQSEEGEGWTDERICEALDTNVAMVTRVRSSLVDDGLCCKGTPVAFFGASLPDLQWASGLPLGRRSRPFLFPSRRLQGRAASGLPWSPEFMAAYEPALPSGR
jgi:Homeodomain-like domain